LNPWSFYNSAKGVQLEEGFTIEAYLVWQLMRDVRFLRTIKVVQQRVSGGKIDSLSFQSKNFPIS
jgi:hypothetical protein